MDTGGSHFSTTLIKNLENGTDNRYHVNHVKSLDTIEEKESGTSVQPYVHLL